MSFGINRQGLSRPTSQSVGRLDAVMVLGSTTLDIVAVAGGVVAHIGTAITSTAGNFAGPTVGSINYGNGSGWLSVSVVNNVAIATVDPAALTTDSYSATFVVSDAFASAGSNNQTVTVNLTVTPAQQGTLVASGKFLASAVNEGESPAPLTVTLSCVGGNGVLADPVVGAGIYQPAGSWLTKTKTDNGDGTFTITLTPDTDALVAGAYRHSFAVSDANCTNSEEVIYDVNVADTGEIGLSVSPAGLSFVAIEGGNDPAPQFIFITNPNPGAGDLAGPVATEDTGSAWLTEGAATGGGDAFQIQVTAAVGALTENTYDDILDITDANYSGPPISIPVSFTVQSATLPQRSTTATLERLRGIGTSSVRGWCGVPLPPGWLNQGQTHLFRLRTAAGVEIPIYAAALGGLHSDNTLKAIYVEFQRTLTVGTPESIIMECGVSRNTANDLTRQIPDGHWDTLLPTNNSSDWKTITFPEAIVNFPASYLSTTQFWGPYNLRYEGLGNGPTWQQTWYNRWKQGNNLWWNNWTNFTITSGVASFNRTQYDYPFQSFVLWASTGNAEYYKHACATLVEWRNRYLRVKNKDGATGGGIAVWEHCPWGLATHYRLTGDNTSRQNLSSQAYYHGNPALISGNVDDYDTEPRPLAWVFASLLAAKDIEGTPLVGTWDTRITNWTDAWLTVASGHDGWITSGPYIGGFWNRIMFGSGACQPIDPANPTTHNFMLALLACVIDQYLDYGDGTQDADAITRLTGLQDFMLTQKGLTPSGSAAVKYQNNGGAILCGQPGPTFNNQADLSGLHAGSFGVASRRLGDNLYTTAAREFLEVITFTPNSGNVGPNIFGNARTFNETFHRSWEGMAKVF